MIPIFRKTRKKMADDNKPLKYIRYAVGEIMLVVIGILLAVQINDWNQKNKNDQLAKVYLLDFKRDLETDIVSLEKRISINNVISKTVDSIFFTLATKNKLSNEELVHFYNQNMSLVNESYFIPEKSTIRQFESGNNSQLISSNTFNDKLFKYYSENDRNEMNGERSLQLYQHHFYTRGISLPLMSGDIFYNTFGTSLGRSNLDLNGLKMNTEYIWSLGGKKTSTDLQTLKYENIKAMAEDLIKTIDLEYESQQ
jgi:hypothetical protein